MGEKKLEAEDISSLIDEAWSDLVELIEIHGGEVCHVVAAHEIGISSDCENVAALKLAESNNLRHLVRSEKFDLNQEVNSSALIINEAKKFFDFPVSSVLTPTTAGNESEKNLKFVEFEFTKSEEKHAALILLEVELEKRSANEGLITKVRSIADELFTNAVFNGPFKDVSRTTKVEMLKNHKGRIFMGKDQDRLVIGCEDSYGSLKIEKLITRIRKCYEEGVEENIRMESDGGAGIGTFMIYDSSSSIYVGVEEGCKTLFLCTLPLNMSSRKMQRLPKGFHFISLKKGNEGE